jgi:hypothetical protein
MCSARCRSDSFSPTTRVSFILAPFLLREKIGGKVQIFRIQYMRHRPQVIDRCVQRVAAPTLFPPHARVSFIMAPFFLRANNWRESSNIWNIAGLALHPPREIYLLSQFCNKGMAGNLKLYPYYVASPTLFPKKFNLFQRHFSVAEHRDYFSPKKRKKKVPYGLKS